MSRLPGESVPVPRFGKYELLELVGIGGIAEVWRARRKGEDRDVALKLLRDPLNHAGVELLAREAQIMVMAAHPAIVRLLEVVEDDGQVALAMELCRGSLADWVRAHGPLPPYWVADVGIRALEALSFAHDQQILHLDLKPANLLVGDTGDIKLADFGIAAVLQQYGLRTETSAVWGTLPFVAPERRFGWPVGRGADLYALACTLGWLATGAPVGDLHVPDVVGRLRDRLPGALVEVLARAGAYAPEDRYVGAREMSAALVAAQEGLDPVDIDLLQIPRAATLDTHAPTDNRGRRAASRWPLVLMSACALVAGSGAFAAGWGLLGQSGVDAPTDSTAPPAATEPPAGNERGRPESPPACLGRPGDTRVVVRLGPRETVNANVADLDADGLPEVIYTNQLDESLSVYWGRADEILVDPTQLQVGRSGTRAAVGDVDEDGHLDLVIAHRDEGSFAVMLGRGKRQFTAPQTVFQAPTAASLDLLDWDADGHLDLMLSITDSDKCTAWRRGRGDGTFEAHLCIGPTTTVSQPYGHNPPAVYRFDSAGALVRHRHDVGATMGSAEVVVTPEDIGIRLTSAAFVHDDNADGTDQVYAVGIKDGKSSLIRIDPASAGWSSCTLTDEVITPGVGAIIGAVADVDGNGLIDLVASATCSGCSSNHMVVLGVPAG